GGGVGGALARGGPRLMGATSAPTGLYRVGAVFDWMQAIGLSVHAIQDHVLVLQELFRGEIARAKIKPLCAARLVTPVAAGSARGHFLTFELADAQAIHDRLPPAHTHTPRRRQRSRS